MARRPGPERVVRITEHRQANVRSGAQATSSPLGQAVLISLSSGGEADGRRSRSVVTVDAPVEPVHQLGASERSHGEVGAVTAHRHARGALIPLTRVLQQPAVRRVPCAQQPTGWRSLGADGEQAARPGNQATAPKALRGAPASGGDVPDRHAAGHVEGGRCEVASVRRDSSPTGLPYFPGAGDRTRSGGVCGVPQLQPAVEHADRDPAAIRLTAADSAPLLGAEPAQRDRLLVGDQGAVAPPGGVASQASIALVMASLSLSEKAVRAAAASGGTPPRAGWPPPRCGRRARPVHRQRRGAARPPARRPCGASAGGAAGGPAHGPAPPTPRQPGNGVAPPEASAGRSPTRGQRPGGRRGKSVAVLPGRRPVRRRQREPLPQQDRLPSSTSHPASRGQPVSSASWLTSTVSSPP